MATNEKVTPKWYLQGAGTHFIETENTELLQIIPKLYGYHLLFLGDPRLSHLVQSSLIGHQMIIHEHPVMDSPLSLMQSELESLPIRNDSVDVVVLSHTLEEASHPHEILREAHRILIPEGHLIITGLNPMSMWGIWLSMQRMMGKTAKEGKMLGPNRIRDWLKLLNFQLISEKMFYFRPPLTHEKTLRKLAFLERWGQRVWPIFAGGYSLVAVKRVIPLTPVRAKWRKEKAIWQPEGAVPTPNTTVNNTKEQ